jgi:hypothetical protein
MLGMKIIGLWLSLLCWGTHQMVPHEHHKDVLVCSVKANDIFNLADVFAHFPHVQSLDHIQDEASDIDGLGASFVLFSTPIGHPITKRKETARVNRLFVPLRRYTFLQIQQALPPPMKG